MNDFSTSMIGKILGTGRYTLPAGKSTDTFIAKDWRLILVDEGSAFYHFDSKKYEVTRGDLFLLSPEKRKIITSRGSCLKISIIFFETKDLISSQELINFQNRDQAYRLLVEMFKEIHSHIQEGFHIDLLNSMLKIFFRENAREKSGDFRIREALKIIKNQNGWRLTADQLSNKVGLSRAHFNTLFKSFTGKTYGDFCREERMQLALTLIQEYGFSSKETAHEIGSSSPQAFSREFKHFFGFSPQKFNRKI